MTHIPEGKQDSSAEKDVIGDTGTGPCAIYANGVCNSDCRLKATSSYYF